MRRLSIVESAVLVWVVDHPGTSARQIEEALRLHGGHASELLRRLRDDGYVARQDPMPGMKMAATWTATAKADELVMR